MVKLTLHAGREVIEKAKRLAAERKTSVSALFSRIIRALGDGHDTGRTVGRLARRASGVGRGTDCRPRLRTAGTVHSSRATGKCA